MDSVKLHLPEAEQGAKPFQMGRKRTSPVQPSGQAVWRIRKLEHDILREHVKQAVRRGEPVTQCYAKQVRKVFKLVSHGETSYGWNGNVSTI
jgi:hypothetical protein